MGVLDGLEPRSVFRYFEALCAIPHGSGDCKAISDYCMEFARRRGLFCRQDGAYNVVIKKPGSPGYENALPVIVQGHLDMVVKKSGESGRDLQKDGIQLQVDGDWVCAKDSTLGGDNGIAVAMGLAILDDESICHPPLEILFTTDEEIGMVGAAQLDASDLQGRMLLNLDSEDEGIFTVSCSGGATATCRLPVEVSPCAGTSLKITVSGLTGGHSGMEIIKGRANACVLLGRILGAVWDRVPFRLVCADGGGKDNAIANSAWAQIVVPEGIDEVRRVVSSTEQNLRGSFVRTDPGLSVCVSEDGGSTAAMTPEDTQRCIRFLTECPDGVREMSRDFPGLVQTSLNLGILSTEDNCLCTVHCLRSSVDTEVKMLIEQLQQLVKGLKGSCEISGRYAPWEYRSDSQLRERMVQVYRRLYGKEPVLEAIHAGLECGVLAEKLPGLDAVSYGPDLRDVHTTRERMSISSVRRVWEFTLEVLKQCG